MTEQRWTLWALHEKVPRGWQPLLVGLTGQQAVNEMTVRQDRVRRSGQPCRFTVKPEGEQP